MNADRSSSRLNDLTWSMNPATRRLDYVQLRVSPQGLDLLHGDDRLAHIDFAHTTKIVTFKRDLLTTDVICVVFVDEQGEGVIVHEEMRGFNDLFDPLIAAFPGIDREWYFKVMQPAFATNERTLWQRPA